LPKQMLRNKPRTDEQAKIALQCDRFRLRFSLLALRINHATPATETKQVELIREVADYARETLDLANKVCTDTAQYKGRTVDRTRTFLSQAMIPSVNVVLAGSLLELARADIAPSQDPAAIEGEKWTAAKAEIEDIITQVTDGPTPVTFRVHYNLACFWARVHTSQLPISDDIDTNPDKSSDDSTGFVGKLVSWLPGTHSPTDQVSTPALVKSYLHLRKCLADAPYCEGVRLARAAGSDPALAGLRGAQDWVRPFKLLVDGYLETGAPLDSAPGDNDN
jgi:hypothetical protein